jgi:hypothetical protein
VAQWITQVLEKFLYFGLQVVDTYTNCSIHQMELYFFQTCPSHVSLVSSKVHHLINHLSLQVYPLSSQDPGTEVISNNALNLLKPVTFISQRLSVLPVAQRLLQMDCLFTKSVMLVEGGWYIFDPPLGILTCSHMHVYIYVWMYVCVCMYVWHRQ